MLLSQNFSEQNMFYESINRFLNNAIDAVADNLAPKGKKIELVGWKDNDQKTAISITDNGSGIPEALIEQIFVPFFTIKNEDSGIGLSLSRQIMRLHGGTLAVQSTRNGETAFVLSF